MNKRLKRETERAAKRIAQEAIRKHGSTAEAAKALGINRVTLWRWLAVNKGVR